MGKPKFASTYKPPLVLANSYSVDRPSLAPHLPQAQFDNTQELFSGIYGPLKSTTLMKMIGSALTPVSLPAICDKETKTWRCLLPIPTELVREVYRYLEHSDLRSLRASSYFLSEVAAEYLAPSYGRRAAIKVFKISRNDLKLLLGLVSVPQYQKMMTHVGLTPWSTIIQSESRFPLLKMLEPVHGMHKAALNFEESTEARHLFDRILDVVKRSLNMKSVGLRVCYQQDWRRSVGSLLGALQDAQIPQTHFRLDLFFADSIRHSMGKKASRKHCYMFIKELKENGHAHLMKELNLVNRGHCSENPSVYRQLYTSMHALQGIETLGIIGCAHKFFQRPRKFFDCDMRYCSLLPPIGCFDNASLKTINLSYVTTMESTLSRILITHARTLEKITITNVILFEKNWNDILELMLQLPKIRHLRLTTLRQSTGVFNHWPEAYANDSEGIEITTDAKNSALLRCVNVERLLGGMRFGYVVDEHGRPAVEKGYPQFPFVLFTDR